jgi:hypothetical protein
MIKGDFDQLDQLATYFRNLGSLAKTQGVDAAAKAVGDVAKGQYAAGKGPDGQAWPRNKDGSIPLQGPTSEIRFRGEGGAIKATAPDVLQYHQENRPVFPPNGQLSEPWIKAADRALQEVLEKEAPK